MQFDWSFVDAVNWAAVAWFSSIAFLATLVGNILIPKYWFWAAILAGFLFAAGYVFLAYYPHERPVPGLKTGASGGISKGLELSRWPGARLDVWASLRDRPGSRFIAARFPLRRERREPSPLNLPGGEDI